jgi:two-component system phosphate regulon sensor histidine kinase PhoR
MSIAALIAVIVAGFLGLIASRLFSNPLTELGGVALRIAGGDFSSRINYPVADELGLLADSLDHLSSELSEKIRQLTEEKTRLSTILRSMGEGVFVVNASGRVVLTNPAGREILSLSSEQTRDLHVEDITAAPALNNSFQRTRERREAFVDEFVIPRGKQRLDVMASTAPLEEDGRFLGMVAVLSDISQVRRLERIRRDFVANVSHELRTPLTAVRGYAETLLDADMDLPEMAEDFLATIHRHAVRLSRLIDDLLALAAIEGRGLDSRLGPVDAEDVVHDVLETLRPLAAKAR